MGCLFLVLPAGCALTGRVFPAELPLPLAERALFLDFACDCLSTAKASLIIGLRVT